MQHPDRYSVGRVTLESNSFDNALDKILYGVGSNRSVFLVNAKTVVDAEASSEYSNLLDDGWLRIPDGNPVAAAMRVQGARLQKRIPGPDLFEAALTRIDPQTRHFLLGGHADQVEKICSFSQAQIAGVLSPPFAPLESTDFGSFISAIEASAATHVWIGLGSPKQDFVVDYISRKLDVTVIGVGAAFDFLSGNKRRAPLLIRKLGAEWLFRLLSEPRRLMGRYLIGNTRFLLIMVNQFLNPRR